MKLTRNTITFFSILTTVAATITLAGSAVRSQNRPTVKIDGSSTVFPITEAVAEEFQKANSARVTVGVSGTGGGFEKFCSNNASVRTDISNASRPIKKEEQDACKASGVEYIELPVAYDAVSIVVDKSNPVNDITVAELKKMWEKKSQQEGVKKWNQVRSGWPDKEFKLYGPGLDSGTYDYFAETILGKGNDIRSDFTPSEDDNVLVRGVVGNPVALGYFGLAYYEENASKLKALKVNGVLPSATTVNNGTYTPLSRPIYIYVNKASANKPEVKAFVDFYLNKAPGLVREVGYVALPTADYNSAKTRFANRQTGRVPLRSGL